MNNAQMRRESGCPVHFIWDGHGHGRPFVRAGFLGFVASGALLTLSGMGLLSKDWALGTLAVSALAWTLGQILVALSKRG